MVISAEHERNGIADFFTQVDPEVRKVTLAIGNIISKNSIKEITLEKSLNVMMEHCRDAGTLLAKNIVKTEYLYKYLQTYNINLPPDCSKAIMIEHCLQLWRRKYGGSTDTSYVPTATSSELPGPSTTPYAFPSTSADSSCSSGTTLQNHIDNYNALAASSNGVFFSENTNGPGLESETEPPGLEQYPVNLLALDYTVWFFLKWNRNSLDESAFWADANCTVMLEISETQQGTEQVCGPQDIINLILSLKFQYNFQLVPNIMFDGCQGRIMDSGVLALSCGVVYNNQPGPEGRYVCLGEFESLIGLRRDPMENNNWKVRMLKLYIRYKKVDNLPALANRTSVEDLLSFKEFPLMNVASGSQSAQININSPQRTFPGSDVPNDEDDGTTNGRNEQFCLPTLPTNESTTLLSLVGRRAAAQPNGKSSIFSFEFYQQFFNVDTMIVVDRIATSMIPKRAPVNYLKLNIATNPDLYGPVWIVLTLIFTIAISGNMASYLQNTGNHQWRYNFHLVSYSATAIITYTLLVPFALWGFLQWSVQTTEFNLEEEDEEVPQVDSGTPSLLSLVCIYGYSLAIYIPVSVLWTIQVSLFQWLLVITGAFLSGFALLTILLPAVKRSRYSLLIVLVIELAHFALAAGFMLYFFHAPDVDTHATMPAETPVHKVTTSVVVNATMQSKSA
uniref:Yip1 domain-containing protein n=1 Tax=Anopheles epiroticus TaxID=199890 RepID=A0A182PII2_9DIPT